MMSATALRTAARSRDSVPVRACRTTSTAVAATISTMTVGISTVSNSGSMMTLALPVGPVVGRRPGDLASIVRHDSAAAPSCDGGPARGGLRPAETRGSDSLRDNVAMSGDRGNRGHTVRRPRVVQRPAAGPGPLGELKDLLYQLYLEA